MIDPTNSEQVEAVDHRALSREWLKQAELSSDRGEVQRPDRELQFASAHSALALVDEVAKLRELYGGTVG